LKDVVEQISSVVDAGSTSDSSGLKKEGQPEVAAPKMTTVPLGKQTFRQDSFAPTRPSAKNIDSVSIASYLNTLGHAVDGLSSFVWYGPAALTFSITILAFSAI